MRALVAIALMLLSSSVVGAQAVDRPLPADLHPQAVRDTALVGLLAGVEILREGFVGSPAMQVRVLGTWGKVAGDSDAMFTRVFVSVNLDGDPIRAFKVGDLWEAKADSIVTESGTAIVYLSYGPPRTRRVARVEVRPSGLRIAAASKRH